MIKGLHTMKTDIETRVFFLDDNIVSVTDTRENAILVVAFLMTERKSSFVKVRSRLSWVTSIGADDLSQPVGKVTFEGSNLGCCYVLTWMPE